MKTKFFPTPVGNVTVLLNGTPIEFDVVKDTYLSYGLKDGTEIQPAGYYEINVDMYDFEIGDTIICNYPVGELDYDGGGECMDNIVGVLGEFTFGMGGTDTEEIECGWNREGENVSKNMCATKYCLPYELWGSTGRGFEFHIIDNPKLYRDCNVGKFIYITIAWENNSKYYAWDIVSYFTSNF